MIGYELFLVSEPGETWMVSRACKEHRSPDIVGKPWVRMEGDIHPCTNGCQYERVLETVEIAAKTFTATTKECLATFEFELGDPAEEMEAWLASVKLKPKQQEKLLHIFAVMMRDCLLDGMVRAAELLEKFDTSCLELATCGKSLAGAIRAEVARKR